MPAWGGCWQGPPLRRAARAGRARSCPQPPPLPQFPQADLTHSSPLRGARGLAGCLWWDGGVQPSRCSRGAGTWSPRWPRSIARGREQLVRTAALRHRVDGSHGEGLGGQTTPRPGVSRTMGALPSPPRVPPPSPGVPADPLAPPVAGRQAAQWGAGRDGGVRGRGEWGCPATAGATWGAGGPGGWQHSPGDPDITCSANGFLGFVEDVITWVWGRRDVLALPRQQRVVLLPVVVGVEELLKPLDELEVVLELALHQPLHRDDLGRGTRRG